MTTSLSGFNSLSQAVSEGSSTLNNEPYIRTSATTLEVAGTHWIATLGFDEPSLSSVLGGGRGFRKGRLRRGVQGC